MLLIPNHLYDDYFKTGSSVICNPPVTNTDIDYVIFTSNYDELKEYLSGTFWDLCGDEEYGEQKGSPFSAYRKDNLNYIITDCPSHYDKMLEATKLATKLNLLEKQQRIDLFHYIVEGEIL